MPNFQSTLLEDSNSEEIPRNVDSLSAKQGKERNQRLKRNVLVSLAVRVAGVLIPLITVPFLLRYLGKEFYGIYEVLSAFAVLLGLGNSGLSYGLMNFLSVCYAERDHERAKQLVSTFLAASIVLLGIIAVIGVMGAFALPWAKILKLSSLAPGKDLPWAVCLAVVCTSLMIFCGILDAVYGAFQNFAAISVWDAASKCSATIGIIAVSYTKMGLGGAVLAGIGVPAIIKLWGVIDLFHFRLPELRPRLSLYRSHFLRSLLVDGGLLLLLTTAFAGIFQVDKIFLGILLGPKPVAEFSILGKIFLLSAGIFALLLRSLWPAYCEAFHRKDFGWIRRWLSLTLVAGVVINCVTGIVLCSLKKPLYKLWLGDAATVPGYAVILSFTACFLMFSWMTAHGAVLNAARILKPQLVVLGTHTILTIVIMPVLITRWKTSGAACAPFLAGLLTSAWGYPFLVRKYVFSCE